MEKKQLQPVIKQLSNPPDLIKIKKPLVMGILNVTPDSFTDKGKYFKFEDATKHARELIDQGVDIIDIGGESTRPGAKRVSEEGEIKRVIAVIKWCRDVARNVSTRKILISIDTYKSNVARKAIEAGAGIINDVSGLTMDSNMAKVARDYNCPIVIMHNKGLPATKPESKEQISSFIVEEAYQWLKKQTNSAIGNGVQKENIIIDVGIGFGKSAEEDLYLIEHLHEFKSLGFLILVGISRKSFIRKLFGECDVEKKSRELEKLALNNGADIVRLHNINPTLKSK